MNFFVKIYLFISLCSINIYASGPLKVTYNNNFTQLPAHYTPEEKPVTIILYMAADNDLRTFVYRNLEEIKYMLRATSATENFNLFIHLDVHNPGQKKMTFHLVAYQKELCIAWQGEMDSGKEETLIFTYAEAMRYCPGKAVVLGLWDHGTGDLNPTSNKIFNPTNLFEFDPLEKQIILNRTIGFIEYIENFYPNDDRGICFDDSNKNYLKNQSVGKALETICTTLRNGKKIDLIFCDACLMSGIGFMREIKPWTNYLIASEEVVLATGFRYDQVLNFFNQPHIDLKEFTKHTVKVFENTYQKLTPDYTLSGIDLQKLDPLYQAIDEIARLLIEALKNQKNGTVKEFIRQSSWKTNCTSFDETTYKDMKHLLSNLLKNLHIIQLNQLDQEVLIKNQLNAKLNFALSQLSECVIAHCAGKNLSQSGGISIYVPETRIHQSFQHTTFAKSNHWFPLITLYMAS